MDGGEEVVYGWHVFEKMEGWVEFQDLEKGEGGVKFVVEVEVGPEGDGV